RVIARRNLLPAGQSLPCLGRSVTGVLPAAGCRTGRCRGWPPRGTMGGRLQRARGRARETADGGRPPPSRNLRGIPTARAFGPPIGASGCRDGPVADREEDLNRRYRRRSSRQVLYLGVREPKGGLCAGS